MTTSPERLLRIVAWISIVTGVLAVVDIVIALFERRVSYNIGVVALWIGAGLLQRRESARQWGVWWWALGVIIAAAAVVLMVVLAPRVGASMRGTSYGYIPRWWVVGVMAALGATAAWQVHVLRHPAVRALFAPRE